MARAAQQRAGRTSRRRGITLLATLWGGTMVVLGLRLAVDGAPLLIAQDASRALGWAGVLGGQFVFMVLVADRCFPRAARGMVAGIEALVMVAFLTMLAFAAARVL